MKAVLLFAATLAFVTAPLWSNGFGGFDPDRFPIPQRDPPVQPAGYAFSIWGPIYLWLLAHAGFGLFARAEDPAWDRARWPLIVSLAPGAAWISVAQTSPGMATVLIWIMLAGALLAVLSSPKTQDRWLCAAPLGLYAGWLTAASSVSIGLMGAGYGVLGGNQVLWAWLALMIAWVIAFAMQTLLRRVPEYGLAVAWALVAVAVRNAGESTALTLAAGAAAAGIAYYALRNWRDAAARTA